METLSVSTLPNFCLMMKQRSCLDCLPCFNNIGGRGVWSHSLHIHGHSVYVLKVGFGEYSSENRSLIHSSRDLTCTEDGNDFDILDNIRCPSPHFRFPNTSFPLDKLTVRKDIFILPAGGYVVVQFRSNDPGYWFLQCYIEPYNRQGMSMII